jgi:hypothetical protein
MQMQMLIADAHSELRLLRGRVLHVFVTRKNPLQSLQLLRYFSCTTAAFSIFPNVVVSLLISAANCARERAENFRCRPGADGHEAPQKRLFRQNTGLKTPLR